MSSAVTKTFTMPNGKRKYVRGKTVEEVEEKIKRLKQEIEAGLTVDEDLTVAQLTQMWYDTHVKGKVSETSAYNIRVQINKHFMSKIGSMKVKSVRAINIQYVLDQSGLSLLSKKEFYGRVKSIFNLAVDNDLILKSPCNGSILLRGEDKKDKDVLCLEEYEAVLAAARQSDIRTNLFYQILLKCGLRKGELAALMWRNVDLNDGIINVVDNIDFRTMEHTGHTKTASGRRSIPMDNELWELMLDKRAEATTNYVIPNYEEQDSPMTKRRVEAFMKFSEPIVGRKLHPHTLRHSCITHWVENGMSPSAAKYFAGHSSINMTMDLYNHFGLRNQIQDEARRIRDNSEKIVNVAPCCNPAPRLLHLA